MYWYTKPCLSFHQLMKEHLDCFHFLVTVASATIKICCKAFIWKNLYLGVDLLSHIIQCETSEEQPNNRPHYSNFFATPSAVPNSVLWVILRYLDNRPSSAGEKIQFSSIRSLWTVSAPWTIWNPFYILISNTGVVQLLYFFNTCFPCSVFLSSLSIIIVQITMKGHLSGALVRISIMKLSASGAHWSVYLFVLFCS